MPEVKVEVMPVGIQYLCDKCGNGYMSRQGGSVMMADESRFKHVCNSCWAESYFTEIYPTVRFEFKQVEQRRTEK